MKIINNSYTYYLDKNIIQLWVNHQKILVKIIKLLIIGVDWMVIKGYLTKSPEKELIRPKIKYIQL